MTRGAAEILKSEKAVSAVEEAGAEAEIGATVAAGVEVAEEAAAEVSRAEEGTKAAIRRAKMI